MSPLPRRLRSFSLRTLMVLVAVVGMALGWVARERSAVLQRKRARAAWSSSPKFVRLSTDAQVHAGWTRLNAARAMLGVAGVQVPPSYPENHATIPWIRTVLGDEAIYRISFYGADQPTIALAARMFPESQVTNNGRVIVTPLRERRW